MNKDEKELLEEHEADAQAFKNFCYLLFIIGASVTTIGILIYLNY